MQEPAGSRLRSKWTSDDQGGILVNLDGTGPLSLGEHHRLGRELHAMRNFLALAGSRVANRYPRRLKSGRLLLTALEAVDRARCELDEQLLRDHPDSFCADIYYPGDEDRRREHAGC